MPNFVKDIFYILNYYDKDTSKVGYSVSFKEIWINDPISLFYSTVTPYRSALLLNQLIRFIFHYKKFYETE